MTKKFNKNLLLETVPQATVTLSSGKKIKIRSFLTKELKILMLANETRSNISDVLVQILSGCIVTKNIEIETLPIFDLEMIFLQIWKLSKGDPVIKVTYSCLNEIKGTDENGNEVVKICNADVPVMVNLNTVKIDKPKDSVIKVNDSLTVEMRYPNILESQYFDIDKSSDIFDLLMRCIHKVNIGEDTWIVGETMDPEELTDLIDYLDENALKKMSDFIQNIPRIYTNIAIKCSKCGHSEPARLMGIEDFFV